MAGESRRRCRLGGWGRVLNVASYKLQVAGHPPTLKLRRAGRVQVTGSEYARPLRQWEAVGYVIIIPQAALCHRNHPRLKPGEINGASCDSWQLAVSNGKTSLQSKVGSLPERRSVGWVHSSQSSVVSTLKPDNLQPGNLITFNQRLCTLRPIKKGGEKSPPFNIVSYLSILHTSDRQSIIPAPVAV